MAAQTTCFQEADPRLALWRRAGVEGAGTFFLMLAAGGGGIAAARVSAAVPGMILPITAIVIASALVALIVALGSVSGGHYNPLITMLQCLAGERSRGCTIAYVLAQFAGGLAGGIAAALLWGAPVGGAGGFGWHGIASELVASAGLMLVVFGCMRSKRVETGPFAVGTWLIAAVIALPTTSFANPAIVIGSAVSAGPVALGGASLAPYIGAEIVGALLALLLILLLFPREADA